MNKVAAFALRRKNSILSMSEKMFCPPQPLRFWITPAYAGKRRSDWIIRSIYWDHPRVCGEKLAMAKGSVENKGSPPRVRGKVQQQYDNIQKERITPAYAGKRAMEEADEKVNKDHPRVCGEKPQGRMFWNETRGSPPRMRGKVSAGKILLHDGGITPACAGKRGQNAKKRYQK